MARGLKVWIWKVEGLYYLCCKKKGADQLRSYCAADLRLCFRIKIRFSHVTAHLGVLCKCNFSFLIVFLIEITVNRPMQTLIRFHIL